MTKEKQIEFLNNINCLGFEDAVALLKVEDLDEASAATLTRYAHYRSLVLDFITQEAIDSLEPESIM